MLAYWLRWGTTYSICEAAVNTITTSGVGVPRAIGTLTGIAGRPATAAGVMA